MKSITHYFLGLFLLSMPLLAQKAVFEVVPLGVKGGIDETNLSAYMLAPKNTQNYICLDAGTINAGIEKAIVNNVFSVSSNEVMRKFIKGYLISHAHLDHVSGLIINSPNDSSKTVYATRKCMQMMQEHYFNGETWANFGDEGPGYQIKKYHFQTLPFDEEVNITNTTMNVTAFPLSHSNPYESSAFLIKNDTNAVLYLGDTGADAIEKSDDLRELWKAVAPLIKEKQLRGIFIEVSFPNEQPDNALYGHLTPNHLMTELSKLEEFSGKGSLQNLKIIITHRKPPLKNMQKIKDQLKKDNPLGVDFIFPEQGRRFEL